MVVQVETAQRLAKVGPLTVHYEVAGEGPAVVLIHGLSGSGRWWAYNVPALAQRYQVYNVDVVGFGRSRGQRLVLREAGGWLTEWMQLTGILQTHLVGHSMGGYIAFALWRRHRERIGKARDFLIAPEKCRDDLQIGLFKFLTRFTCAQRGEAV